ncbi:LCP family protein [Lentzea sp. NPDC060358]|uniref:LCP family glycopolymer transferase n=1 Tax=Lentzea sp. NPDC060358 TaxID=3347103 RepID=UPI0036570F3E
MSGFTGRRRLVLAGRVLVVAATVATFVTNGYGWFLRQEVAASVTHIPGDVFADLGQRPEAVHITVAAPPPKTVLLLGSDVRLGPDAGGGVTGQRADTILIAHLPQGRDRAEVLSVPRDSWVDVAGFGMAKVNASLAYGGVPLAIRTVEEVTGIRIDHVVVVDFAAVRDLTTALGGVVVDNPAESTDPLTRTTFAAGRLVLQGDRALTFVRQRYGLPGGDIDRITRQHVLLSAVVRQIAARALTDGALREKVLSVVRRDVSTDSGLDDDTILDLFFDIATLPSGSVSFHTAPVAGSGTSADGQAYLELDRGRLAAVAEAVRSGKPMPLPPTISPS